MRFHYTAIDRAGAVQKGEREAVDEKELSRTLRQEGLLLTLARPAGKDAGISYLLTFSIGGVSLVDRMVFARNLGVMVGAGISVTRALEALEEQSKNKKFKLVIGDVKKRIREGISLSAALNAHRQVFGDFFVHMIEAGEVSGKFEGALRLLARQMKRDHDLRAKVRGAMMYPAIVFTALVGIGILMLVYVVPTLTQTFKELEIQLPPTTQFIISASDFVQNYAIYTLGGSIMLAYVAYRALRSSAGRAAFDQVILRVPVLGPLTQKLNAARMSRTLASLIAAGLSITKALDITSRVLGNSRFRDAMKNSAVEIEKGRPFSEILKNSPDLFPPLVIQMISVGEETGTLSRMLLRIALFYEEDINNTTKNLSSIIEPIMMIFIGAIVGFFAISMIQPLYSSLSGIQ
ncbi:MAG: type II secretion system F family protein [Candidatus Sungbacteria bacterium]|nr:type II secretion system F family protein [Candidatus Sungbacteria bacterium]